MARVYSVLLKKALPKKPSLSRNGATQPKTDSIVQFYYCIIMYFGVAIKYFLNKTYARLKEYNLTANRLTD